MRLTYRLKKLERYIGQTHKKGAVFLIGEYPEQRQRLLIHERLKQDYLEAGNSAATLWIFLQDLAPGEKDRFLYDFHIKE